MTTKVTIDAHAGWPVKVIPVNSDTGNWESDGEIVAPHTVRDFYVWDGRDLIIHEVRAPRIDPSPASAD